MKATVSLRQLRTNPREYVRLLGSGYEVAITEHRKVIARARQPNPVASKRTNAQAVLKAIRDLPNIQTPHPTENTVDLVKRTRRDYLERKYGYKK